MKKRVRRIILAGIVFAAACLLPVMMPQLPEPAKLAVFLTAYLLTGYKVLRKAVRNIFRGNVFDENFLMAIASVGAFCIGEYPEAVAVMLFYQVGECFEDFAVGKSRKSIADLMNLRTDTANLVQAGHGGEEILSVSPEDVPVGSTILIRPGEKIPLDGIVREGESLVDTAALTGETMPREVRAGSEILSGCINLNGVLRVQVTRPFGDSTVSKILELVENATMKKAKTENFITRFAAVYTPAVVIGAVLLAVVPSLVVPGAVFSDWLYRALNFLVVSCPCALVISVPLSFFGGIGGASREGILVKGSSYLELLADTEIAVMDKTGTLTRGMFEVVKVYPEGVSENFLLQVAATAEIHSSHPIGQSLKRAAEQAGLLLDISQIGDVEERSGQGIIAAVRIDETEYQAAVGNQKLMDAVHVKSISCEEPGSAVHVSVDGSYAGYILIADQVKDEAVAAVASLKLQGIRTVMLTGDSHKAGEMAAQYIGIDEVYSQLLPGDKVEKAEELIGKLEERSGRGRNRRGRLIFAGDGINDAPVLARADVGIAMGGLGSDAAIEAADVVIMNDELSKLPLMIRIAKKTMKIVRQNIAFALGIKLLVLALSAVGHANMWMAVFADVGVSMLAIMNSFRAMKIKEKREA